MFRKIREGARVVLVHTSERHLVMQQVGTVINVVDIDGDVASLLPVNEQQAEKLLQKYSKTAVVEDV